MSSKIQAKVSYRFKASAERVYDTWLDPEKVRRWMKAALAEMGLAGDLRQVQIDPRVGGRFVFADMRGDMEARHWGTYLELDRPRRIVFTWITDESEEADPSKVTLTIQPEGAGCVATLVHEMDAAWADYREKAEKGWTRMMTAMDTLLATTGVAG